MRPKDLKLIINVGCGPPYGSWLPGMFDDWRTTRIDIDPAMEPDIVASANDLSQIESGTADVVWSAHCVEHLFLHEVSQAIAEFHRVLKDDGFACIIVPDLQAIGSYIASDRIQQVIYQSPAGPVTVHDMLFGYGPALEQGVASMAHRCGFTPTLMLDQLHKVAFAEVTVRRRTSLELAAVACKTPSRNAAEREALLTALEL